ncbi:MAG: hypothetical protein OEU36_08845 [Gammaproteobacteria bacterium]|nr:hypothetical protein [Gammaproteobacteria bacterium]
MDDFLITDRELARQLDTSENVRESREKLLIQSQGDEIGVSLFVDEDVITSLDPTDPTIGLTIQNIEEFCLALEGVSHFLYLAWNAHHQRSVTLLELELQAEVDKYITLVDLLQQEGDMEALRRLRNWLFEKVSFDPNLSEEQLTRYRDANHYAGKYCMNLESLCLNGCADEELLRQLRRFYRLTQGEKIHLIRSS